VRDSIALLPSSERLGTVHRSFELSREQVHALWSLGRSDHGPLRSVKHVIIHSTEGPFCASLTKLYPNGNSHYLIDTDGTTYSIMPEWAVADHAGVSRWDGRDAVSTFSIGIEFVGYTKYDFTQLQYRQGRLLLHELLNRYSGATALGHYEVAVGPRRRDGRAILNSQAELFRQGKLRTRPGRGRKTDPVFVRWDSLGVVHSGRDPDVMNGIIVPDSAITASLLRQLSLRCRSFILPDLRDANPRPNMPFADTLAYRLKVPAISIQDMYSGRQEC